MSKAFLLLLYFFAMQTRGRVTWADLTGCRVGPTRPDPTGSSATRHPSLTVRWRVTGDGWHWRPVKSAHVGPSGRLVQRRLNFPRVIIGATQKYKLISGWISGVAGKTDSDILPTPPLNFIEGQKVRNLASISNPNRFPSPVHFE